MENNIHHHNNTILGIKQELEAVFTYVFGWVSGILFLLLEKENQFVRFHALQSIAFTAVFTIIYFVLLFIPIIGWIVIPFVGIISFILWIYLMIQAYKGNKYKLYMIGDWVESQL